jgi:mono/diheme cytochrome c family protein
VTASTPAGCTGTPATSQSCTYTPPAPDGAALYTANCSRCHGALASSDVRARTAAQITSAGMTRGLPAAQIEAIADALK